MANYIEQNLGKEEVVVSKAQIHPIMLLPHIILIFFIVGFFTIWKPLFAIIANELGFTNKRLIGKTGLINTQTLDTPLNKINNISVQSGLFGKIFGYGTVNITSSSGAYSFAGIKNAEAFKNAVLTQVDQFDDDRIQKQAEQLAQAINN